MKEEIQALLFSVMLAIIVIISLIVAFTSLPAIVLGTELNTNGSVEYLCLGNDCNELF